MARTSQVTTLEDETGDTTVATVEAPAVHELKTGDLDLSGEKVTVTIHPLEGDGGNRAVFISHNGYAYQIPRGQPCSIPVEVFEILNSAKTTTYHRNADGSISQRDNHRFAFSTTA